MEGQSQRKDILIMGGEENLFVIPKQFHHDIQQSNFNIRANLGELFVHQINTVTVIFNGKDDIGKVNAILRPAG